MQRELRPAGPADCPMESSLDASGNGTLQSAGRPAPEFLGARDSIVNLQLGERKCESDVGAFAGGGRNSSLVVTGSLEWRAPDPAGILGQPGCREGGSEPPSPRIPAPRLMQHQRGRGWEEREGSGHSDVGVSGCPGPRRQRLWPSRTCGKKGRRAAWGYQPNLDSMLQVRRLQSRNFAQGGLTSVTDATQA